MTSPSKKTKGNAFEKTLNQSRPKRPMEEPDYLLTPIRDVIEGHGLNWPTGMTVRANLTQTSFRMTLDLASEIKKATPVRISSNDLHTTLGALYIADTTFRDRIDAILTARDMARKIKEGLEVEAPASEKLLEYENPDLALIRDTLLANKMGWEAKFTVRNELTQGTFRNTLDFAEATKKAMPTWATLADLHVTLSALYVADLDFRNRVDTILHARMDAKSPRSRR